MKKPSVFVGSSGEGLEMARALAVQLADDAELTVWNEGVFQPGLGTLESLVNALDQFDFAALILTPDDLVTSRAEEMLSPRDNVMFELGLFMGRLGRSRTFALASRARLKLPSDLAGVTLLTFDSGRSDGNLVAALGPAAFRIRQAVRDLGLVDARSLGRLKDATSEVEGVTQRLVSLVEIQARSRQLELQVIVNRFRSVLHPTELASLEADLARLQGEVGPRS